MAIRNLQASVSAANRLNLTGIAGEAVGSLTADDGYYVLGLDTFNVANTNPEYNHMTELCMCNKNIYTFPDGIKKVGAKKSDIIYVVTSGNELYAMGNFYKGDGSFKKIYPEFTYITGNVLDAHVDRFGTFVIDTDNNLYGCGTNSWGSHLVTAVSGTGNFSKEFNFYLNAQFSGSWNAIDGGAANESHMVGIQTNGKLYEWGVSIYDTGNVLSGMVEHNSSISDWSGLFIGAQGAYVTRNNGEVYSWGVNYYNFSSSPSLVSISNVKTISHKRNASFFLTNDKKLYGRGANYQSIFGTGNHGVPVFGGNANRVTSPVYLYISGMDDIALIDGYSEPTIQELYFGDLGASIIAVSGGNIYGWGDPRHLPHYPANLEHANYTSFNGTPGQINDIQHPSLMETGNWTNCEANYGYRAVWNSTELGIGTHTFTPAGLWFTSQKDILYKNATFFSGAPHTGNIFQNTTFDRHRGQTSFTSSIFKNAYVNNGELYSWGVSPTYNGNLSDKFISYPPDVTGTGRYAPIVYSGYFHTLLYEKDWGELFLPYKTSPNKANNDVWDRVHNSKYGFTAYKNESGYFQGHSYEKFIASPQIAFGIVDPSGSNNITGLNTLRASFSPLYLSYSGILGWDGQAISSGTITTGIGNAENPLLHISSSNNHTLIVDSNNRVYAEGKNKNGQLGVNSTSENQPSDYYTEVSGVGGIGTLSDSGIIEVFTIADGPDGPSSYALSSGGDLFGWGDEYLLGYSSGTNNLTTPVYITGNVRKLIFSPDESDRYIITNDNKLYSWGHNSYGGCLLGDTTLRYFPTQVGIDSDWSDIYILQPSMDRGQAISLSSESIQYPIANHDLFGRLMILEKTDGTYYLAGNCSLFDFLNHTDANTGIHRSDVSSESKIRPLEIFADTGNIIPPNSRIITLNHCAIIIPPSG